GDAASRGRRDGRTGRSRLWDAYRAIDRRSYKAARDALAAVELAPAPAGTEIMSISGLGAEGIARRIADTDLDVAVSLCGGPSEPSFLGWPRRGVLSFETDLLDPDAFFGAMYRAEDIW